MSAQHIVLTPENHDVAKTAAVASLRAGDVVCMAMDGAYIYAAYAFNQDAVYSILRMRGSNPGTQLQVLVGEINTALGIATDFSGDLKKLGENFWPGPLTLLLSAQRGLAWDLGDSNELPKFALRIPYSKFLRDVLSSTGPVAIASASVAGMQPLTDINFVQGDSVALYIDEGILEGSLPSTVVQANESGLCEVVREGAIARSDLLAFATFS